MGFLVSHGMLIHLNSIFHGCFFCPILAKLINHVCCRHSGQSPCLKLPRPQGIGHICYTTGGVAFLQFFKTNGHDNIVETGGDQIIGCAYKRCTGSPSCGNPQALFPIGSASKGMPKVRLMNHFKKFHVSVDNTVHVIHCYPGMIKRFHNSFMDHFRLIYFFSVA